MRSVRFAAFGDPADVLTVEDVPTPLPGVGEVLVRMRVRPINPSDLFTIRGQYGRLPSLPATPGMEGVGIVTALGEGVTGFQVGQQVISLGASGTWQEYVVAASSALMPVPPGLSEREASMLLANPTSAWLLLHEELRVEPTGWVMQNAANSAVGRFVIQLSRRAGFRTINIVRRRDVIDELLALGADVVICEADEDVVARVRTLTHDKGVRYALDAVGGESGARLARALGPGGTMVVFGAMSGQPLPLDPGAMIFRGTTVRGWWLSQWFRKASPAQIATLLAEVTPLIIDGTLHVPVDAEYALADIKVAVAAAEGSQRNGKILLVG